MKDYTFVCRNTESNLIRCYLEEEYGTVILWAQDPTGEKWIICTLREDGALELLDGLPEEYFNVDKDGKIKVS